MVVGNSEEQEERKRVERIVKNRKFSGGTDFTTAHFAIQLLLRELRRKDLIDEHRFLRESEKVTRLIKA